MSHVDYLRELFREPGKFQVKPNMPGDLRQLFSRTSTLDSEVGAERKEYFRTDGSVFLTDTSTVHLGKRVREIALYRRGAELVRVFEKAADFYKYWLSIVVAGSDSLVVVDSKYSATFLGDWSSPQATKLYAFHSSHVKAGQDLMTGELGADHSKIINDRNKWDGLVFLTRSQRDAFTARFGVPDKAIVISNPIKSPGVGPASAANSMHTLICAGSLTKRKNVDDVIRIMAILKSRQVHAHLDIVGEGPEREAIAALAEELKVHDRC